MYRLLIVDDEARIRSGLAEHFPWNDLGFIVAGTSPNGKEAEAFVRASPVDVVLTDIRMPILDGLELAERLAEGFPEITIVLLSGYTDFEYARRALLYSVKHYLLKPVKYDELVAVFAKIRRKLDAAGAEGRGEAAKGRYDKIVETVKAYVRENLLTASLEGAAEKVELSPNYLSMIFKQRTGMNFSDYLLEVKMGNAAVLLGDVRLKIYEISEAVGYDNPKNFARAFKRSLGKSPRRFREGGT